MDSNHRNPKMTGLQPVVIAAIRPTHILCGRQSPPCLQNYYNLAIQYARSLAVLPKILQSKDLNLLQGAITNHSNTLFMMYLFDYPKNKAVKVSFGFPDSFPLNTS